MIPWSPLARGFLAGNRTKTSADPTTRAKTDDFAKSMYFRDNDFEVLDAVEKVAKNRGVDSGRKSRARGFFRRPASPRRSSAQPN